MTTSKLPFLIFPSIFSYFIYVAATYHNFWKKFLLWKKIGFDQSKKRQFSAFGLKSSRNMRAVKEAVRTMEIGRTTSNEMEIALIIGLHTATTTGKVEVRRLVTLVILLIYHTISKTTKMVILSTKLEIGSKIDVQNIFFKFYLHISWTVVRVDVNCTTSSFLKKTVVSRYKSHKLLCSHFEISKKEGIFISWQEI